MKKLSILISTLVERKQCFERLLTLIEPQLTSDVELLVDVDNREVTLGAKRQRIIEKASGDYIVFVDDDDVIPGYYVSEILKAIEGKPDCVGINGIITTNAIDPKPFYHSIKYDTWFEDEKGFYRCPNHLNPIKREIVLQVGFNDIAYGEDFDYSTRMVGNLHTETYIEKCMYYYLALSAPIEIEEENEIQETEETNVLTTR